MGKGQSWVEGPVCSEKRWWWRYKRGRGGLELVEMRDGGREVTLPSTLRAGNLSQGSNELDPVT